MLWSSLEIGVTSPEASDVAGMTEKKLVTVTFSDSSVWMAKPILFLEPL